MQHGTYGEVYNVGSGKALEIQALLNELLALSTADITVEIDREKYRPVDVPLVVCDNTKLVQATGWQPAKPLQQTLLETLNYWREQ